MLFERTCGIYWESEENIHKKKGFNFFPMNFCLKTWKCVKQKKCDEFSDLVREGVAIIENVMAKPMRRLCVWLKFKLDADSFIIANANCRTVTDEVASPT
jgi:hypothetical protein